MIRWFIRWYKTIKRRRYERWAAAFAAKHDLPFEGIMMLGGYRIPRCEADASFYPRAMKTLERGKP